MHNGIDLGPRCMARNERDVSWIWCWMHNGIDLVPSACIMVGRSPWGWCSSGGWWFPSAVSIVAGAGRAWGPGVVPWSFLGWWCFPGSAFGRSWRLVCWLLEGGVCFLCLWPWDDLFLLAWGDGVLLRGDRDLDLLDWCPVWLGGVSGLLLDRWWWSLSWCLELVAVCLLSFVSDLWNLGYLVMGFLLSVVLLSLPSLVFVGCYFLEVFGGDLGLCWLLVFIVSLLSFVFRVTFLIGVGSHLWFQCLFHSQGMCQTPLGGPLALLGGGICMFFLSSSVTLTSWVEPADHWYLFSLFHCFLGGGGVGWVGMGIGVVVGGVGGGGGGGVAVFSFSLFFIDLLLYNADYGFKGLMGLGGIAWVPMSVWRNVMNCKFYTNLCVCWEI